MIKPIESLTDDIPTTSGHNTEEKNQSDGNDTLLPVITTSETTETVELNVTTCNTGIDVSNVNTDTVQGNIDNSSDHDHNKNSNYEHYCVSPHAIIFEFRFKFFDLNFT